MGEIISEETPFDRVQFLLEQWNMIELLPDFKDKGIDEEVLQELTKEDIDNLIPAEQFGLRIKFRKKLFSWQQGNERQQEFNTVLSTADATRLREPRPPSAREISICTVGRQNINNTSCDISEQVNTRKHYVIKENITNKNIENNKYEYKQQSSIAVFGAGVGKLDEDVKPSRKHVAKGNGSNKNIENDKYEYKQQSSIVVFGVGVEGLFENIVKAALGGATHNILQNGINFLKVLDETVIHQG